MKTRFNQVIYIVIIIPLVYSIISTLQCNKNQSAKESIQMASDSTYRSFVTIQKKDKTTITTQKALIMEKNEAIAMGLVRETNLKKIKSQIRIIMETKFDTIKIPFEKDTSKTYPFIGLGCCNKSFKMKERWFTISGFVDSSGISLDRPSFINEFQMTIGFKKKGLAGLFNKELALVELINYNPYTSIKGFENVIIQNEKKWWERDIWKMLITGSAGVWIGWKTRGKIDEPIINK